MSHQCIADAFAPVEAAYRSKVLEATWGHLALKRNTTYKGRIVYGVGCFGSDHLNPTALFCEFEGVDSSPWFFDALQEFIQEQKTEEGCVYEFKGYVRNYVFKGNVKLLLDTNKRVI